MYVYIVAATSEVSVDFVSAHSHFLFVLFNLALVNNLVRWTVRRSSIQTFTQMMCTPSASGVAVMGLV